MARTNPPPTPIAQYNSPAGRDTKLSTVAVVSSLVFLGMIVTLLVFVL